MFPKLWDITPHKPIAVEPAWSEVVQRLGGKVISHMLSGSPDFENADFLFEQQRVVLELKEVETEFSRSKTFRDGLGTLVSRLMRECPDWRPELLGGDGNYPPWFSREYVRLFRHAIARIMKKGNRQLRETKRFFKIEDPNGILLFVNDGFTSISPNLVLAVASDLLTRSYSSIDCLVYLTVNRYVDLPGSDVPNLIWAPVYSSRANSSMLEFINWLGVRWFDYLEEKIGTPTIREVKDQPNDSLLGSMSIILPGENRA